MMRSGDANTLGRKTGGGNFKAIPASCRGKHRDPFLKLPATRPHGHFMNACPPLNTDRKKRTCCMAETGTVKFFNTDKGFGFIKPDNGGADIFVHISAVQASGLNGLSENQKVSFDTEPDRRGKGPKAVNLQISG
jgi:cold shock protein